MGNRYRIIYREYRDSNNLRMIKEYPFIESQRVSGGSHKQILKYLIERFKTCYHCGVKVIYRETPSKKKQVSNNATIDHLISRYLRSEGEKVPKVLSCYKCNQKLSKAEVAKYGQNNGVTKSVVSIHLNKQAK